MRKFLCILTILMCVVIYSSTSNAATPTRPDYGPVHNALAHYEAWERTIDQAERNVDSAFNAAMKVVNDFKSSEASIRNTMYSSLPAGIKSNMVSALSSALGIGVKLVTDMINSMTLADVALQVFGIHETKLDTFNNLWDGGGTVTRDTVRSEMQAEVNESPSGLPGVQADSLMEAFYRYEYAVGVYNLEAQAWNRYAPSQAVSELTLTDPVKREFTKIGCFNHCGDFFDTFSSAEGSHKEKCGTGENIDLLRERVSIPEYTSNLAGREVSEGCGRDYYDCPSKPGGDEHEIRTCVLWVWEKPTGYLNAFKSYQCDRDFRRCMLRTYDHNPFVIGMSAHSDEGDDEDEQQVYTPTPSPSPTPAPTYHACGVHETSVSGDHSWIYRDCPSGHAHYACDGSNHSIQASCSSTNANGDSCTVTGFYACQTHTHQYPDPNVCSAAGCDVRITSSNAAEHALVTCTGNSNKSCGQPYYACQSDDHKWLTCMQGGCGYLVSQGHKFKIRRCKIADTPRSCVWINGHRQKHTPYLQ